MATFGNEADFNLRSQEEAWKGIVAPMRRVIAPATILYRFGNSPDLAMRGGWWLEERQFARVRQWAIVNGLALPHAYRVLCAVAHGYGDMLVLVSARVKAPLLAYEGRSRTQRPDGGKELLAPIDSRTPGSDIVQLYIPGLRVAATNAACLAHVSTEHQSAGASHIGGVTGMPAGATLQ